VSIRQRYSSERSPDEEGVETYGRILCICKIFGF